LNKPAWIDDSSNLGKEKGRSMLRSLKNLRGYNILASDGEMGKARDFFFEDDSWCIRCVVVDTGHWLLGRKVLLAPGVFQKPDWSSHSVRVLLTKEQVEKSPDVTTDLPVSRRKEIELHQHYGWPMYWVPAGAGPWYVFAPTPLDPQEPPKETPRHGEDPHLQSVREVTGYHIQASDGAIGHLEDFIADDVTWEICYLVVDTRNWLPGRQVLIPPHRLVQNIQWAAHQVEVALTRESVRNSPDYDPNSPVNHEIEKRLYDYFGRPAGRDEREAEPGVRR